MEKKYAYWLCNVPGVGDKTIMRLLGRFGSAQAVYEADEGKCKDLLSPRQAQSLRTARKAWDLEGEYQKLAKQGISFTSRHCGDYPKRLDDIPDPPYALFWKGALPKDEVLSVAVVGARDCSEYGKYVAQSLGEAFAQSGIQVVSGMARGIDGISQQAALKAGGTSFAVLGCGVDICYPARNRPLYDALLEQGGILSPYLPGTPPAQSLFPPRNRIVSALADLVIVVEARQKSGTLITVDAALEQGKEVYAVPGRLTDRLSDGCNRLIRQGAGVLLSPQSLIEDLVGLFPYKRALTPPKGAQGLAGQAQPLSPLEEGVLKALDVTSRSAQEVRGLLKDPPDYPSLQRALMKLCLLGLAGQSAPGYYYRLLP